MLKQDELPPGWQTLDDDERIAVCEGVFRYYIHEVQPPDPSRARSMLPCHPSGLAQVRVPDPFVTYSIGPELGEAKPPWTGAVRDFYDRALEAFRSLTAADGFLHAADTDYDAYRFYPHFAEPAHPWVIGVPGAIDWNDVWEDFIVPPDFSWVFTPDVVEGGITLSGQALIDAFSRSKPSLFSAPADRTER